MPNPFPRTLLLVDDDPDVEVLVRRVLQRAGLNVRLAWARDGQEALDYVELARGGPQEPDAVLVDLRLPGVTGFEFLRRMAEADRGRRIPLVVFTSSTEPLDVHQGYRLGAASFVRKPIDADEFAATVEWLARYWLGLNVAPRRDELPPRDLVGFTY